MPLQTLLWLALLVLLGLLFLLTLRRMSALIAPDARTWSASSGPSTRIERRLAGVGPPLVTRLDDAPALAGRPRTVLREQVGGGRRTSLAVLRDECRDLPPRRRRSTPAAAALAGELERAARAALAPRARPRRPGGDEPRP